MIKKYMKIEVVGVPVVNYKAINEILEEDFSEGERHETILELMKFSQACARQCYSDKDFSELSEEGYNPDLIEGRILKSGHHSVFEHINFSIYMNGIPKILAMIFNNEKQYATSEKSARYTKMKDMEPLQREKYDFWMGALIPEIDKIFPQGGDKEARELNVRKLAQENARYVTSVFTPTKMVHTINWRQLNFLLNEFERGEIFHSEFDLTERLVPYMKDFFELTKGLKVEGLENQTDRGLSLFSDRNVETHFGDTYSLQYLMSFAGLAQAHRHRTINYHVSDGTQLQSQLGYFIPKILRDKKDLKEKWLDDLSEVSKGDFPQAQLLKVNERGIIEDFRSKAILRMCGHAQHEIMENTLETAKKYSQYQKENENALTPKCQQDLKCRGACVWGGKNALERLV